MTDTEKLRNTVGLAMKAGKCRSGDFIVEKLLKSGGLKLIILDTCVSPATEERYRFAAESRGIPIVEIPDVGEAIGKPSHRIVGVTDEGFTNMILRASGATNPMTGGR